MKNFIERLEAEKAKNPENQFAEGFNFALTRVKIIYNELHPQPESVQPEPNKQHTEGSFKVRVTDSRDWYSEKDTWYVKIYDEKFYVTVPEVGCQEGGERILKSDCEIIPETTVIAFDYKRWKDGDYVRVVTRDGVEVTQLHEFDGYLLYPFSGVIVNKVETWTKYGTTYEGSTNGKDLHLEIAKPKPKQVTTYHYIESTGYVRGSSMSKHELVNLIGETTTEQQENGEWKIVKTTLK